MVGWDLATLSLAAIVMEVKSCFSSQTYRGHLSAACIAFTRVGRVEKSEFSSKHNNRMYFDLNTKSLLFFFLFH